MVNTSLKTSSRAPTSKNSRFVPVKCNSLHCNKSGSDEREMSLKITFRSFIYRLAHEVVTGHPSGYHDLVENPSAKHNLKKK